MAAVGDDCYFFCTSTCAKGAACPFRHVESAKTNKVICQHWQTTGCFRPMCKFRHSDFHIQVNYSEIPCYWESQPVGCSKANCVYKHSKPRSNLGTTDVQVKLNSPEQKDDTKDDDKETFDQFVMPTVKPVIIDPESETSNSSPVKKPPSKEITEETPEQAYEQRKEGHKKAKSSGTKKGNLEAAGKIEGKKKVVKVVGKKKKAGVLTQKNGKLSTVAKSVKKGKKAAIGSPATKAPVKKKKTKSDNANPVMPTKKLVKDRLGTQSNKEEPLNKEESSSSDSDDSIENVKVLSMEEIFRQKALESMMKKRAAEGKPMLPEYGTPRNKPAIVTSQPSRTAAVNSRPSRPVIADIRPKKQVVVKKKTLMPPPPPQESSESEEEEEQHEIEAKGGCEAEEEDSSSSESDSSSSDSSESEVRRVVINLDAEKAAREKAKVSLVKRHHIERVTASKTKKRKVIHQESMSFSRSVTSTAQQGLSVKERLGKPNSAVVIAPSVTKREVVREVSSEEEEDGLNEFSNKEDSESYPDVKVKSLDEIRHEKLNRLSHSPIKDRLGPSKTSEVDDGEEEKSGRKFLITEDKVSPNKARKRPWSAGHQSKTKPAPKETRVEEDQRTVSATSPVDEESVQGLLIDEPESSFESLRRRALLKKTLQVERDVSSETKNSERSDDGEEAAEEEVSGKRKKHKHKHKHKKHKRSKSERQIYVPPAKKSVITQVLEQVKKLPSLLSQQEDIPEYVEDISISKSPSTSTSSTVQGRPKPRAGAMWAAGLSVSSKGLGGRPHLKVNTDKHDDDVQVINVPPQKPSFMSFKSSNSNFSSSTKDSGPSVPVVKTFSQIMAEKRQKRQQAQESGVSVDSNASSSSSIPSRMSSQSDNSKQRGVIKPVKFDHDGESKVTQPTKAKPAATSVLNLGGSSQSPPSSSLFPSRITTAKPRISPINHESISSSPTSSKSVSAVSLSEIRPAYKTARAKKLFNKKAATKTQAEVFTTSLSTLDSPTNHISSSPSSTLMDKVASSSTSSGHHHHPSEDAVVALKSPTADGKKQRRPSTASESHSRQSISLDDEFSIFEGGDDIEDISNIVDKDVEPIDDLLQDIDDLLS